MNTVRTVSDTKRAFYTIHTRPINSIYRRVIEELMVEMHLLLANQDFHYDPIFALGVVTSFDRFMQGYRPAADQDSIFQGLCRSLEQDPQKYRQDAEQARSLATRLSTQELVAQLGHPSSIVGAEDLQQALQAIATQSQFKYSRLFAVGLFTLLETTDAELVKDDKQRVEALKQLSEALHLPQEKMGKDLDLYRSNLEKMAQARAVMEDLLKADRKQREQRSQPNDSPETPNPASDPSKDQTPSGS